MGYWAQWGSDQSPSASLNANASRINLFAPYWYTLRSDGTLGSRETGYAAKVKTVHANGNKVVPLINKVSSNAVLTSAATRQAAVNNIYQMVISNGFDGVNIDFEGMPASTRAGLTAFMNALATKLHAAGLLVTMAVPAKWSADDSTNDFAACFDYAALGRVVDYLVIMTYDQHAGWSGPGPVAGADWTDKVIRYATTVVPAKKILLGLAGYGYDWSPSGAAEITAKAAPTKAAAYGAPIVWDNTAQVPHFTYWQSSTRHDVWYENSYSVEFKVDQVNRYGLGGVALWALGQEDTRFWQVINGSTGWTGGLGGTRPKTMATQTTSSSKGSGSGSASTGTAPADTPSLGTASGPNAGLKLSAADIDLLAHLIYAEAGAEPYLGQVAVGAVVLNRLEAGGFGNTVAEVIYQPGQFEPVMNGRINIAPSAAALQAAQAAAQGQDPTNGALYFWNPAKAYNAFLSARPLKVIIGNHRFVA